jgi:peptidoglycan hydrolase CwlO-like protein
MIMLKYILPFLLFATPALAQTVTLTAEQWREVAQSYRSELIQLQGQQDDANAQISLLQQQVQSLNSQLAETKPTSSPQKK